MVNHPLQTSRNHNFSNALKDFKTAVAINSTNGETLNAYAWFLSICPDGSFRNGKYAVELANKACELSNWKTWNYVGTLAAAYAESGNFEQAIKYEKQAMSMEGISNEQINKEADRLKLFENNEPTHEAYNIWSY